jgi:hypothetical protein
VGIATAIQMPNGEKLATLAANSCTEMPAANSRFESRMGAGGQDAKVSPACDDACGLFAARWLDRAGQG